MTKNRHKSFGSPNRDTHEEPVTFEIYDEEFECRSQIQGATLLRFVEDADSGDGGRAAGAMLDFFKRVLQPESFERFEVLWEDPDRIVPMETMGEIVSFLVEEYTKRPTQPSRVS